MNSKTLKDKIGKAVFSLNAEQLDTIERVIREELELETQYAQMRQMEIEHFKDKIASYETPWWERAYEYPLGKWECPKCLHKITKDSLRWNWMTSENVCPVCKEPQRQFALPPYSKQKEIDAVKAEVVEQLKRPWWQLWK